MNLSNLHIFNFSNFMLCRFRPALGETWSNQINVRLIADRTAQTEVWEYCSYTYYTNNLAHYFSCMLLYIYFRVKAYRELNLVRAFDEDTRVSPSTSILLHWARQQFLGIPPFISDPGNLCLLLDLL